MSRSRHRTGIGAGGIAPVFCVADPHDRLFAEALGVFYGGASDQATLKLLGLEGTEFP